MKVTLKLLVSAALFCAIKAERNLVVSGVFYATGLQYVDAEDLPVCETSAGSNKAFDNYTWWNLQLQLPTGVGKGGNWRPNVASGSKEDGFVQTVNSEEVVFVNWTLADDDPQVFDARWTFNDRVVWESAEFCRDVKGCIDKSETSAGVGFCLDSGGTTRSAELKITVDCCSASSGMVGSLLMSWAAALTAVILLLLS